MTGLGATFGNMAHKRNLETRICYRGGEDVNSILTIFFVLYLRYLRNTNSLDEECDSEWMEEMYLWVERVSWFIRCNRATGIFIYHLKRNRKKEKWYKKKKWKIGLLMTRLRFGSILRREEFDERCLCRCKMDKCGSKANRWINDSVASQGHSKIVFLT